ANLQEQLTNLQEQVEAVDELEVARYEKLRQKLKAEQKLLKTLYKEAYNVRNDEISMMLGFAVSGTLLSLKGK
ncbi:hypothetical protein, partial [Richelia intracellularis]|uniref:hypothetical protein n=1 Tax=Richelia intracellularis TaxID=1164990 RepID=UPI0005C6C65C